MFDEKMRKPRESVADNETQREILPISASQNPHEQQQTQHRTDKMQIARQRLTVFGNIEIPKFSVISQLSHFCFRSNQNKDESKKTNLIVTRKIYCDSLLTDKHFVFRVSAINSFR